jgi:hypothetical protein
VKMGLNRNISRISFNYYEIEVKLKCNKYPEVPRRGSKGRKDTKKSLR